jgi:hypothetical protein
MAPRLLILGAKYPNKNRPSIPPLKMEASFHYVSKALCTLIIAMAIRMLKTLNTKDDK